MASSSGSGCPLLKARNTAYIKNSLGSILIRIPHLVRFLYQSPGSGHGNAGLPHLPYNWLQVFKRAHTALLGSGGGPEQRTSRVPPEKCVAGWGSDNDEMRRITASF